MFGVHDRASRGSAGFIDEQRQLRDVMGVCVCPDRADRHAAGVYDGVVLGTGTWSVRGVKVSFAHTPTARTDEESTAT